MAAPRISPTLAGPLLLIAAAIAIYAVALPAPFVFDDTTWIVEDPNVRSLEHLRALLEGTSRPILKLTLALNHAAVGTVPAGYRVVNVVIHVLSGLVLFGLVRRTLRAPACARERAGSADALALAAALMWLVHPLATQAVTYVIQRGESLMALFYLFTLYCAARKAGGGRSAIWIPLGAGACALGMGTKEVMVTAPIAALLYDRTFFAGSFAEALRRRWLLHLALAATWGVMFGAIGPDALFRGDFAGSEPVQHTRLEYALTQPAIVLHYLRLCLWPHPLVFDYGWSPVEDVRQAVPALLAVIALGSAAAAALWRRWWPGYTAAFFLLVLAPTSSIHPIEDLAVEHRAYLPLAAVAVTVVLAAHAALRALAAPRGVGGAAAALATCALAATTVARNLDYRSELSLWQSVVRAAPENPRGHYNLGTVLKKEGRSEEAIVELARAVALDPGYSEARNNLGNTLLARGDIALAIHHFEWAVLESAPEDPIAYFNLARAYHAAERLPEAEGAYRLTTVLAPRFAPAYYGLGQVLAELERSDEALDKFEAAVRLYPPYTQAHAGLARLLEAAGRGDEAARHYRQALELDADQPEVRVRLRALEAREEGRDQSQYLLPE